MYARLDNFVMSLVCCCLLAAAGRGLANYAASLDMSRESPGRTPIRLPSPASLSSEGCNMLGEMYVGQSYGMRPVRGGHQEAGAWNTVIGRSSLSDTPLCKLFHRAVFRKSQILICILFKF